jgi:hypothetical protein
MEQEKEEEWRPVEIPYFKDRYSISSFGRLRSERGPHRGKILTRKFGHQSIETAILYHGPVSQAVTIHRLVAEAFIGPRPKGFEINHKDGDRTHNFLSNLEYGTKAHNVLHAQINGLYSHGTESYLHKLSEEQIYEILSLRGTMKHREIAKLYNVCRATIGHILRGRNWKHITKWPRLNSTPCREVSP